VGVELNQLMTQVLDHSSGEPEDEDDDNALHSTSLQEQIQPVSKIFGANRPIVNIFEQVEKLAGGLVPSAPCPSRSFTAGLHSAINLNHVPSF
jgi:hypothetical protein